VGHRAGLDGRKISPNQEFFYMVFFIGHIISFTMPTSYRFPSAYDKNLFCRHDNKALTHVYDILHYIRI